MTDHITTEEALDALRRESAGGENRYLDTLYAYIIQSQREIDDLRKEHDTYKTTITEIQTLLQAEPHDDPAEAVRWALKQRDAAIKRAEKAERHVQHEIERRKSDAEIADKTLDDAIERTETLEAEVTHLQQANADLMRMAQRHLEHADSLERRLAMVACPVCGLTGANCHDSEDGFVCAWMTMAERAEKAEAEASVRGGEWCARNRKEGRGPCGACAWCCAQERASRDTAEAALRLQLAYEAAVKAREESDYWMTRDAEAKARALAIAAREQALKKETT